MRSVVVIACAIVATCAAGCSPSPTATRPTSSTNPSVPPTGTVLPSPSPSASPSPQPALTPSPTPYPRLPIPAGTPRCHTAQLEVAFVWSGAALGNVEELFEIRNKSASACWAYGFVGFQALDGQGRAIPETIGWTTDSYFGMSDPPTRILLPTGTAPLQLRENGIWSADGRGHAFFDVWTNDVLCDASQPPAATLEIWPPDEVTPLKISADTGQYLRFSFCRTIELNPLQIQPGPRQG